MKIKSLFLEIGRWVVVLAAIVSLFILFGGNTISNAKAEDVATAVTAELDMSYMVPGDNQMIKRF